MTSGAHRKVVTVLFCDVVGSTALGESVDPEALQGLFARYFERMSGIVASHGGSVEKFIGDAVMAVFGVPVTHEDDALRACRAAVEMCEALPELGIAGRIGINTGEVLTGTEERLATGDAVNVAARLEQAAEPGEVLIGSETLGLAGSAVEIGEKRLLDLKGKSEPVAAYPLLAVHEAAERAHSSRFVGRERELQQLVDAWDRALSGPRCELVTLVGDAGVGKSRLVAEALAGVEARVVRGRCLPYGEGITYWPVVEVVKQLVVLPSDPVAAAAIRSLLGESEVGTSGDEIAWAVRKLLEEQAPLVVCFDDLQWGEETFLELVESTALLSTGAPLMLLCMARPELLDRRPSWPAALRLEPLREDEAEALVGDSVPEKVREEIVRASGGNPLFVTEMLALAESDAEVEVPATLWALLAARLDQLDQSERRVLECGAVEGELFHRGIVQALAPEETELTSRLAALVRRDLVRPDRSQLPHEDAYRFRHLLIRDAAYDALPKATRADLHRRFAEWLDDHGQSLVELDEILGYHLEQAFRYGEELGRPDPELALRAGDRLAAAGRRAELRGDLRAEMGLLERALELTRPLRLDVHLELDLAWATGLSGERRCITIATNAAERAHALGDRLGEAKASLWAAWGRLQFADEPPLEELEQLAREAFPLFEQADDHYGLASAWGVFMVSAIWRLRFEDAAIADEQALHHAKLAGVAGVLANRAALPGVLVDGPRPAEEALRALDAFLPDNPTPEQQGQRGRLLAMLGRFEEARSLAWAGAERELELVGGHGVRSAMAEIARLAGEHEQAEQLLHEFCDELEAHGQRAVLSSYAPIRGRALCALGRYEEAEPLAQLGRTLGSPHDVLTQALWRQVQALVHAHRGQHPQAEQLAREAVAILEPTDALNRQGDALCDLAEVLQAAGRRDEAIATWQEALQRYERKGIIPLARRVRERLTTFKKPRSSRSA